MWERFSYYGMRGFLILYMTAPLATGGMGLDTAAAAAIYGTYTSMVYLMSLPGGWIADRLIGQRRAVLYGGILIAAGHFSLAVPWTAHVLSRPDPRRARHRSSQAEHQRHRRPALFAAGYPARRGVFDFLHGHQPRRVPRTARHGLSGAGRGVPRAIAGWGMDPNSAWHWGFGAAGVGMTLGLIQYVLGGRRLGSAGLYPTRPDSPDSGREDQAAGDDLARRRPGRARRRSASPSRPASCRSRRSRSRARTRYILLGVTVAFFAWLYAAGSWTPVERKRLYMIGVYFVAAALFWSVFEQAGSTLNLFADRSTNNVMPIKGEFPSSWWQSVNALLIFILAPLFAWLWVTLGSAAAVDADEVRARPDRRGRGIPVPGARRADRRDAAPKWACPGCSWCT